MRMVGNIRIPEKETYKIRSTTDYRQFRFIDGNRPVDHAEKIEKSIREIGLLVSPIVCDENMRIIDGQNRFTACRNLGLPVYYVVMENIGDEEVRAMNSASKNWTGKNYIHYYAHGSNPIMDYKYFEQLIKAYPWATQRVIAYAIHGDSGFGYVRAVKDGTLKCTTEQYERAVEVLDYVEKFRPYIDGMGGRKENYYFVIAFCHQCTRVDNEYLLQKFDKYHGTLEDVTSVDGAIKQVESRIYNYQLRSPREPIDLEHEYKSMMRAKLARKGKE